MHNHGNLILTGFMGTGKTTVGREIAKRLGREFVDMDALIEARTGLTVGTIFQQQGEAYFRRLEADLCRELASRSGLVIATGGGTLIPDLNRELLMASGTVVCLTASLDEILRRLARAEDRPLLQAANRRQRLEALLAERATVYERIPLRVDTTGFTVDEVADQVLAVAKNRIPLVIPVRYPGGIYTVYLGHGLLARCGELLRQQGLGGRIALVTNPTVGNLYASSVHRSLTAAGFEVVSCLVPDGEMHKTFGTVEKLYSCFIEADLDRYSTVLALGGGVISDIAGFAAATYLRGVSFVQLPTTLLAMVDASIGGKVGIDHPRGKNAIGAFKQPTLVIGDLDTLHTLAAMEFTGGLAEVVKAGLVGDPVLFEQIETHGPTPLPWLIERAVRIKVAIVEEDPYENGRRAVLNLGHTFAHALELLSGYTLSHGQAVSVGLVGAARLSARLGLCESALATRVESVLARLGLPTSYQHYTPHQVWQAMATDKKRRNRTLRFVVMRGLGDVFVCDQVSKEDVLDVLTSLRDQ